MKLIVGLGNPGDSYAGSRHNIGFCVVKALGRKLSGEFKRDKGTFSLSARVKFQRHNLILATPLTFMNLSGNAVKDLARKYKISPDDLLVVCDDLDLELARIRIRPGGSSGGHRGLASIIGALGSNEFARLRIGIGRQKGVETSEYVLRPFTAGQKKEISGAVDDALECCLAWAGEGPGKAMNIFNRNRKATS